VKRLGHAPRGYDARVRGDVDAVLIGAGHNALVAANVLAEHGWSVLVPEEQDERLHQRPVQLVLSAGRGHVAMDALTRASAQLSVG
jgi:predicted oxidoreductase